MCFTVEDADLVVNKIDQILTGLTFHLWFSCAQVKNNYVHWGKETICFRWSCVSVWLVSEIEKALGLQEGDAQHGESDSIKRKVSQSTKKYIYKEIIVWWDFPAGNIVSQYVSLWFDFKLPVSDNGHQHHDTLVSNNGSNAGVLRRTKRVKTWLPCS